MEPAINNTVIDNDTLRKLQLTELEILDEFVRLCEKHKLSYFLVGGTLIGAVRHKGFIPWDDDIDVGMPRKDYDKLADIAPKELGEYFFLQSGKVYKTFWLGFSKIRKNNTRIIEDDGQPYYKNEHRGIYIDIFPFDKVFRNKVIIKCQQLIINKTVGMISLKRNYSISPNNLYLFTKKIISSLMPFKLLQFLLGQAMSFAPKDSNFLTTWPGAYGFEKEKHPTAVIFPLGKLEFEGKYYNVPGNWDAFLKHVYGDYTQLPPIEKRKASHAIEVIFDLQNTDKNA